MGKTTDKLRAALKSAATEHVASIVENPRDYVDGAVREFVASLRADARGAVLSALGIEARWGRLELDRHGPLYKMLEAGLADYLAETCKQFADEVVLSEKEKRELHKEVRELYMMKLTRHLADRIEARLDALSGAECDAMIDELVGPVEAL